MTEKNLTKTEAEYKKALAEREKLHAELERLTKKETQQIHYCNNLVIYHRSGIVRSARL